MGNWIPDFLKGTIRFLGSPGICSYNTPSPGPSFLVFLVLYIFGRCFDISGPHCSMVPYRVVICGIIRHFHPFFLEYVEMVLSYSVSDPIKYHFYCSRSFLFFLLHWQCCFLLCCILPPVLVVVGGPYLLGPSSLRSIAGIFQKFLQIILWWLMPLQYSLCCILHALVHFMGVFIVLVCWILVLGKISSDSDSCLWFWYARCIQVNVDNHSSFFVLW